MRLRPGRRGGRAVLLVAIAVCIASWLWLCRPWEAHYKGRPARYWAEIVAAYPRSTGRSSADTEEWLSQILDSLGIEWDPHTSYCDLYSNNHEAVPVLIELLKNPNRHVQATAASFLSMRRPPPKQAVPALLRAWQQCKEKYRYSPPEENLEGTDAEAAVYIHDALWDIDPEAAERAGVPRDARPDDRRE